MKPHETTIREYLWDKLNADDTLRREIVELSNKGSTDTLKILLDVACKAYVIGFLDGAEGEKPTPADG